MSYQRNSDDLLINFDIFNHDDSKTISKQPSNVSTSGDLLSMENENFEDETKHSMPFMCSTVPIYKLLSSDTSNDLESNNPFDQMDKQAALLDDPFEIVENAVARPIETRIENIVETGQLISIDSPTNTGIDSIDILQNNYKSKIKNATDTVHNISPISSSDQNRSTPQKTSSTGKHRGKTRNSSLNLLKYSLSNSRSDMFSENGSPIFSDDNVLTDENLQKELEKTTSRKDSTTDDSFDDIWATKPNLIDSQTDMDIESDVDSDLAKLNIPMLRPIIAEKKVENEDLAQNSNTSPEEKKSAETKHLNRSELIEKLASIKLKNPSSPMQFSISLNQEQFRDQTADMNSNLKLKFEDEPVTPKSHYSKIPQQDQVKPNNPDFLIEHLKNLVDQCDDINKQTAAKSLLDNLSAILDLNQKGENIKKSEVRVDSYTPQPIKREGTFNLDECDSEDISNVTSHQSDMVLDAYNDDMPGLSQVMKQIQNVLGTHQNINVLQTNMQTNSQLTANTSAVVQTANPTYIVVMAQPPLNINNGLILDDRDSFEQYPLRTRSQSLSFAEKPLAASRASQNKLDQPPIEATPIRRLTLPRRSSFTAMTRPNFSKIESKQIKSTIESNVESTSTIKRRTSLQLKPEPQSVPQKNINLTRRRSFQEPSASRIRSPSPKTSIQSRITSGVGVTRRKSFHSDVVSKDSPQKVKTLHSMMKKPPAPPATRNLKIRVTQTMAGRSTAPLRATVPINRVAPLLMDEEMVSPMEDHRAKCLITSTPRSILPSSTNALKLKKADTSTASLAESPVRKINKDSHCVPAFSSKVNAETAQKTAAQRRRTLSDYRVNAETTDTSETGASSTTSNFKKATTTLTNKWTRLRSKRLSNFGNNGTDSKENKYPK